MLFIVFFCCNVYLLFLFSFNFTAFAHAHSLAASFVTKMKYFAEQSKIYKICTIRT